MLETEAVATGLSTSMLPVCYLGLPLITKSVFKLDYEPHLIKSKHGY